METIQISRKVTTSALGLDSKTLLEAVKGSKGKAVEISQVLAMVQGYSEAPNKLNAQNVDIRFKGNFEATNLLTGEVVRAGEAFFPSAAAEWLKNQYDAAKASQNGTLPAMAFIITVKADDRPNSAKGYLFGVKAIVQGELADPFAALRKALPKPK